MSVCVQQDSGKKDGFGCGEFSNHTSSLTLGAVIAHYVIHADSAYSLARPGMEVLVQSVALQQSHCYKTNGRSCRSERVCPE